MKRARTGLICLVAALGALAGCASTDLAFYDFGHRTMAMSVRVAPDAAVDASYSVVVDANDPVRTALSIGSSLAKANQVAEAEEKMRNALRGTDIGLIVEEELSEYLQTSLGVQIVGADAGSRNRPDLEILIDVEDYGIEAGDPGGGVTFHLSANARLYDLQTNDRIWRTRESVSEPVSPDAFGLPPVAGNVLSAVALSELTEEEIGRGIERLARSAAWDIGAELERDIDRARRRR